MKKGNKTLQKWSCIGARENCKRDKKRGKLKQQVQVKVPGQKRSFKQGKK